MAKYPESVIAEIRDRTDIVELVGAYVNLKRSGRNHLGLCPFHQEKTPSFNVSPERNIYHCFGCGVTGDAYRFLMEHDQMSFPEAVRTLAERAGVDLAQYDTGPGRSPDDLDELYRANDLAVRLYRRFLEGKGGEAARAELKRRGVSAEITEKYRLGASPPAWDRLLTAARKEGIRPSALERAGLCARRDSGTGHYDRFRGRLMFPIELPGGKVCGFGGRILGEGEPKYLNTPETALFHKRRTLYGFPQARDALRERGVALLVEGYTDVLALAQAGHGNALASLGTAFTEDHARALARSVDRVVVVFDGDEAGRKAAQSSAGPLLGAGLEVAMVMLPSGQDPDSLLRAEGEDGLRRELDRARPALDVLLGEDVFGEGATRERAIRRALEALAHVEDPLRRRVYVEDLATRASLPGSVLQERLHALRRSEAGRAPGRAPRPARVVPADAPVGRPDAVERTFLAVLLHDPALGAGMVKQFRAERFDHPLTRRIFEKGRDLAEAGELSAPALLEAFQEDAEAYAFLGALAVADEYAMEISRQAQDCSVRMERRGLEREMKTVMLDMKKANARGDAAEMHELVRRRGQLAQGIEALRSPGKILEDADRQGGA